MSSGPYEGLITQIALTRRLVIYDIKNKYNSLYLGSSAPSIFFFYSLQISLSLQTIPFASPYKFS